MTSLPSAGLSWRRWGIRDRAPRMLQRLFPETQRGLLGIFGDVVWRTLTAEAAHCIRRARTDGPGGRP